MASYKAITYYHSARVGDALLKFINLNKSLVPNNEAFDTLAKTYVRRSVAWNYGYGMDTITDVRITAINLLSSEVWFTYSHKRYGLPREDVCVAKFSRLLKEATLYDFMDFILEIKRLTVEGKILYVK